MPQVPIVRRNVVPQVQGVKWHPPDPGDSVNEGRLVFVDMLNCTYEFELTSEEKAVVLKEMMGGIEIPSPSPKIEIVGAAQ